MSDLIEFLLARIAEDESRATDFTFDQALARNGDYGRGGQERADPGWWAVEAIGWTPARVLAECEAKRRIVQSVDGSLLAEYMRDESELGYDDALATMELVLCNLALPYADHPDYRPEWRP